MRRLIPGLASAQWLKSKVKVSRDRPRWPKGFRVGKASDFLDVLALQGW